jgi:hypothetical protein
MWRAIEAIDDSGEGSAARAATPTAEESGVCSLRRMEA